MAMEFFIGSDEFDALHVAQKVFSSFLFYKQMAVDEYQLSYLISPDQSMAVGSLLNRMSLTTLTKFP